MQVNNLTFRFDNEAFDYGGSSRFSNDLLLNKFPSITVYNETTNTSQFKLGTYFSLQDFKKQI